jgi:hypothetical protein
MDGLRGRDYLLHDTRTFFDQPLGFYRFDPFAWYQYSSLAFLSTLFSSYERANVFHYHGLMMLCFTVLGIYFLARSAFSFRHTATLTASVFAAMNSFYVSTFYTGHEGSLVFGALVPFITALLFIGIKTRDIRSIVLPAAILTYCLVWTYPYPAAFVLIPVGCYWLYEILRGQVLRGKFPLLSALTSENRTHRQTLLLVAIGVGMIVAMGAILLFSWNYFEPVRADVAGRTRSWGISFYKEMALLYWGIVPSPIAFSKIGGLLRLYPDILLILGYALSILYFGSYVVGVWSTIKRKEGIAPFLLIFSVMWVGFYIFMRYFVADTYYFYKFLYTTSFVPLIVLAGTWLANGSNEPDTRRTSWMRRILLGLLSVFALTNFAIVGLYNYDLISRPYNGSLAASYADVDPLHSYLSEGLFSAYALNNISNDHGNIAAYQMETRDIRTASPTNPFKYELRLKPIQDIFETVRPGSQKSSVPLWENQVFRVAEAPKTDFLIPVDRKFKALADSWYGPEHTPSLYRGEPFRWVSYKLDCYLLRSSNSHRYLEFCVEPGPGYDNQPFDLFIYGVRKAKDSTLSTHMTQWDYSVYENAELLGVVKVLGLQCSSVPLPRDTSAMMLRFLARREGRNLLPYEERFLDYRLSLVHLSNGELYLPAARILNEDADIVPKGTSQILDLPEQAAAARTNLLCVWNGWYPLERQKDSQFRWVKDYASLYLVHPDSSAAFLHVDLERGPGLGTDPATLSILVNGVTVDSLDLSGSHEWKVRLPRVLASETVITFHVDREGKQIGVDRRILNFRIFRTYLSER